MKIKKRAHWHVPTMRCWHSPPVEGDSPTPWEGGGPQGLFWCHLSALLFLGLPDGHLLLQDSPEAAPTEPG